MTRALELLFAIDACHICGGNFLGDRWKVHTRAGKKKWAEQSKKVIYVCGGCREEVE